MKRSFESAFATVPHHRHRGGDMQTSSPQNMAYIQPSISHEDFAFSPAPQGSHNSGPNNKSCYPAQHMMSPSSGDASFGSFPANQHPLCCIKPPSAKRVCIRSPSFKADFSLPANNNRGWNMHDERHKDHYNLLKRTLEQQHSQQQRSIDIVVQCMNGRKIEVMIDPQCPISDLKHIIMRRLHLDPNQQRLVFHGRLCPDNLTIDDLGITHNSHLQLILQLRGG